VRKRRAAARLLPMRSQNLGHLMHPPRTFPETRSPARHFAIGLARAVGGAVIFGLPLLMTMEMWELAHTMPSSRLALLVLVTLPLLVGLSHVSGFEETFGARDDIVDACVAWSVGSAVGALGLALLGVIDANTSAREAIGMTALQAVPASIGALLAQSQLGGAQEDEEASKRASPAGYWNEIFLMLAGALFLAFNIAPTEEMVLIAYRISPWHTLALAAVSLVLMHAFVYAVEFSGQHARVHRAQRTEFLRYTVVGYSVALLVSAYVLWTFGRFDDTAWAERVAATLVLGFPAAVGAAAARLIL
jgi:putative integral membrane protein (TIGR02587 family)